MGKQYWNKWRDDDWFGDGTAWLSAFGGGGHHHKPAPSTSLIDPSPSPTLPVFDAANFQAGEPIDNPYFPVIPGTVYTYGTLPDEEDPESDVERNDVFATFETKQIAGVTTFVVRDTAYLNGILVEDTLDWYAQDKQGNVWYFGEITYGFEYNAQGKFMGTSTDGSWIADNVEAFPGYAMPTREVLEALGNGYYQEFAPGIAEDQADLVTYNATADLDIGFFKGLLQTLDTTQLEPDQLEYKKYEPGVGLVAEEELNELGEVQATIELLGIRLLEAGGIGPELFHDKGDPDLKDLIDDPIDLGGKEQPELSDFSNAGSEVHVTYLGGNTDSNNALGVYTFDLETGLIDDVSILFPEADELDAGDDFVVNLDSGEGFGLFLVPDGGDLGINLSKFEDGGLEFRNFASGGQASIYDGLAPLLVDEDGTVLPIPAFHALDVNTTDDWNLLNPAGGIHAIELEPEVLEGGPWDDDVDVLGFEDLFATDPLFDGDFDDLVVAISQAPLPAGFVADLAEDLNLAAAGL